MLTARDSEIDYITGITLGSDDYFTKPFSALKLTMRVKAIFRRIEMEKEDTRTTQMCFGDVVLLPEQRVVRMNGSTINSTITELNLLAFLIEQQPRAVHREELLNKIWGYEKVVESRVTDDTVKRLRKKILESGSYVKIETVWGFGFKLMIV